MATKQITDDNFQNEINNSEVPVLVDFWAEWCGPCKQIGPVLEEISSEYDGRISIIKVNIDENPVTPTNYGIRGIPTLLLFIFWFFFCFCFFGRKEKFDADLSLSLLFSRSLLLQTD